MFQWTCDSVANVFNLSLGSDGFFLIKSHEGASIYIFNFWTKATHYHNNIWDIFKNLSLVKQIKSIHFYYLLVSKYFI